MTSNSLSPEKILKKGFKSRVYFSASDGNLVVEFSAGGVLSDEFKQVLVDNKSAIIDFLTSSENTSEGLLPRQQQTIQLSLGKMI